MVRLLLVKWILFLHIENSIKRALSLAIHSTTTYYPDSPVMLEQKISKLLSLLQSGEEKNAILIIPSFSLSSFPNSRLSRIMEEVAFSKTKVHTFSQAWGGHVKSSSHLSGERMGSSWISVPPSAHDSFPWVSLSYHGANHSVLSLQNLPSIFYGICFFCLSYLAVRRSKVGSLPISTRIRFAQDHNCSFSNKTQLIIHPVSSFSTPSFVLSADQTYIPGQITIHEVLLLFEVVWQ